VSPNGIGFSVKGLSKKITPFIFILYFSDLPGIYAGVNGFFDGSKIVDMQIKYCKEIKLRGGSLMDKSKEFNKPKSDISTKKLYEICTKLDGLNVKLWVVVILLTGILIVAIADL
jgi:hypothetical protein